MNIVRPALTCLLGLLALTLSTGLVLMLTQPLQHVLPGAGLIEDLLVLTLWLVAARQAVARAPATAHPTSWKALGAAISALAVLTTYGTFARGLQNAAQLSVPQLAWLFVLLALTVYVGWLHFTLMLHEVRGLAQHWRTTRIAQD